MPSCLSTRLGPALSLLALIACTSCSSALLHYNSGNADLRVDSAAGSSWSSRELKLDVQRQADGIEVQILGTGAAPASSVLLQVSFDPSYTVTNQLRLCDGGAVSLLTAAHPGVLGFGVIMPPGQTLQPGVLASFKLVPDATRQGSAAPSGDHGKVSDLAAALSGPDVALSWGYWNAGDYDQNSEANISDLTPLASRLHQSTSDGDLDALDKVLDGDSNGEVNLADITPLGVNFLRRVSSYHVYRADGPDPDTANSVQVGDATFDTSTLAPQSRRLFGFTVPAADTAPGAYYFIRAYDASDSTEGAASNVVQLAASAPVWTSTTGITAASPGDSQVLVGWGEATDADAPPVHYVVYYNAGATVDFGTAQTAVVDAPALTTPITGLANGTEYAFAVRARDSAVPANEDSNTQQLTATPVADLLFNSVPAGTTQVDPALGQNPSLLLLPAVQDIAQEGAPVIAYSKTDATGSFNTLNIAYFRGSSWQNTAIQDTRNFTHPKLLWNNGEFVLIAFDTGSNLLLDFRLNPQLQILSETTIVDGLGTALTQLDVDVDPQSGDFGVASGFGTEVLFSQFDGSVWTTDPPIYTGDNIGGVTFRFDPNGGDPWLLYTHGTIDTSNGLLLNFDLDSARRSGGTWSASAVSTISDSPLAPDLDFKSDGTPELALTVGADFTAPIPGNPFTATMLYHVYTGLYDGAAWNFTRQFKSAFSVGISGGFPPTALDLTLDFVPEADWTRANEIIYTRLQGTVTVDINTFAPTGGSLSGSTGYIQDSAAGFNPLLGYFTGDPGLAFSWQELNGRHACAYIKTADQIDFASLLNGNIATANAMVYWQAP